MAKPLGVSSSGKKADERDRERWRRERERERESMFGIMVVESQGYNKHFKAKSVSLWAEQ